MQGNGKQIDVKRARDALGADVFYDLCYFFREHIQMRDHDIKVIMTRKCLFLYWMIKDCAHLEEKGLVLADSALPYHQREIRGKRVLLIDDVAVSGYTLADTVALLQEYCAAEIELAAYMKARDSKMKSEVFDSIVAQHEVDSCVWHAVSANIVSSLWASTETYLPLAPMFYFPQERVRSCISNHQDDWKLITEPKTDSGIIGMDVCSLFRETQEDLRFFVRMYFPESQNTAYCIPYYFMRQIDPMAPSFHAFHDYINNLLPEQYRQSATSERVGEFDYRLMTYIMGIYKLYHSYDDALPCNELTLELRDIAYYFGRPMIRVLEQVMNELRQEQSLLQDILRQIDAPSWEVPESVSSASKNEEELAKFVKRTFENSSNMPPYKHGERNEELAGRLAGYFKYNKDLQAKNGLRTLDRDTTSLFDFIKDKGYSNIEICSALFRNYDSGQATVRERYLKLDSGRSIIANFSFAGEQSFNSNIKRYEVVIYSINRIRQTARKYEGIDAETFVDRFLLEIQDYLERTPGYQPAHRALFFQSEADPACYYDNIYTEHSVFRQMLSYEETRFVIHKGLGVLADMRNKMPSGNAKIRKQETTLDEHIPFALPNI